MLCNCDAMQICLPFADSLWSAHSMELIWGFIRETSSSYGNIWVFCRLKFSPVLQREPNTFRFNLVVTQASNSLFPFLAFLGGEASKRCRQLREQVLADAKYDPEALFRLLLLTGLFEFNLKEVSFNARFLKQSPGNSTLVRSREVIFDAHWTSGVEKYGRHLSPNRGCGWVWNNMHLTKRNLFTGRLVFVRRKRSHFSQGISPDSLLM